MESALENALQFGKLGAMAGLAGAVGMGGSIWLSGGRVPLPIFIAFPLGAFVGGFLLALLILEPTVRTMRRIALGSSKPTPSDYSDAQAMAARGHFRDALRRYRHHADENPDDARPLIRGARILRDEIGDPAGAVTLLERGLRIEDIHGEAEITLVRELTDLLADRLDQPARALPHLARIADRYADSRAGEWATRRMAALRTQAWTDVRDDETDALTGYQKHITGRGEPDNG